MINISINDKQYKIPESWDEIDLAKGIELTKVCYNCPDKLKEIYKGTEIEPTDTDYKKTFPLFYGEVLACLTGLSSEDIGKILWQERTAVYSRYLAPFAVGVMFQPVDYEAKNIESFKHDGETYYLPKSREVLGSERMMAFESALTFTEAADLEIYFSKMQKGKIEGMANIISILCRPEGEEYNEEKSLARAEGFMTLPMTVVWEVFFFLTECIEAIEPYMETYSHHLEQKLRKQQSAVV